MALSLTYWLGPRRYSQQFGGARVRVKEDLRRCVTFVGHEGAGGDFVAVGTAFYIRYDGCSYCLRQREVDRDPDGQGGFPTQPDRHFRDYSYHLSLGGLVPSYAHLSLYNK